MLSTEASGIATIDPRVDFSDLPNSGPNGYPRTMMSLPRGGSESTSGTAGASSALQRIRARSTLSEIAISSAASGSPPGFLGFSTSSPEACSTTCRFVRITCGETTKPLPELTTTASPAGLPSLFPFSTPNFEPYGGAYTKTTWLGRGLPYFVINSSYTWLRSCSDLGGTLACFAPAIAIRLPMFCDNSFIFGALVAAVFQYRAASGYFF